MANRAALVVATRAGVAAACLGCGHRPNPPPPEPRDAAAIDASAEVEARPLGLPELASFEWRKRAAQPPYRTARKAEARGDWSAVAAACQQALAADPGHLDAAWLLAVALAKLGKTDPVLGPLHQAVAGDLVKWGDASLEHPALQAFGATPLGAAWRRRVEQDRAQLAQAIARGVTVTAGGELYTVDVEPRRWYRLTPRSGSVVGALAAPTAQKLAYVVRKNHKGKRELGIGVIDLARGTSTHAVMLGAGPVTVAYSAKPPVGFWVGSGAPRALAWRQLDDAHALHPLPPRTPRPSGPWLTVTARGSVRLHALPPNVTADWDDQSLASAIRIGTSNRVVLVPSPGLIDGNTAAWSPDRLHFAFVAQLDDHCAAGAVNTAAFVADGSTGATRELERAAGGIALQWLGDRKLVIADDHGVAIRSIDDGAPPVPLDGATGLVVPRERPRCAPVEADEVADEPESLEAPSSDEPTDAGVRDAR
jgi:hypothetical protein